MNEIDYGFYTVGSKIFISKIEAVLAATVTNDYPKFIFNDAAYDKFNWAVEPTESLEELYAKRARELRNKYDYLILQYSGGWDSHNILEIFIRHKIPIDEIYIRGPISEANRDINDTSAANMFAEAFFNAYPIAQYVKETYYPNLIITVDGESEYVTKFFSTEQNTNVFFSPTRRGASLSPSNLITRANSDIVNPRHRALLDSGKTVCHMVGIDKPMMHYENGEYRIRFLDKLLGLFFPERASSIDLPTYQEPFYWAPSTGPLIAKQGHTIRRYFQANKLDPNLLNNPRNRGFHDMIAKIIYNRQIPIRFHTAKFDELSATFPWDNFFLKDTNAVYYKNWKNGMDQLDKLIPTKWKHDGTIYKGVCGIFTKSYSIG